MGAQRDHRLAGVDANPDLQLELIVVAVQLLDCFQDAQARADRALGVVLVRHRRAEHGHHRVADEFLHGAAVALDHLLQLRVVWTQPGAHVLGVGLLRGRGEAHQVTEEHRDDLALLAERGGRGLAEWGRAERAEGELAGEVLAAVRTCGHAASLAQDRALSCRGRESDHGRRRWGEWQESNKTRAPSLVDARPSIDVTPEEVLLRSH